MRVQRRPLSLRLLEGVLGGALCVLAFVGGGTGGSAVHVTRKVRRKNLWKVNTA